MESSEVCLVVRGQLFQEVRLKYEHVLTFISCVKNERFGKPCESYSPVNHIVTCICDILTFFRKGNGETGNPSKKSSFQPRGQISET